MEKKLRVGAYKNYGGRALNSWWRLATAEQNTHVQQAEKANATAQPSSKKNQDVA